MNTLKYLAVLPVTLILASCGGSKASPATSSQTQMPTVEVVKVISQPLNTTLRLPGELEPYESVALLPKVSGFLDKIFVDRGSKVKSGQLLAQLVAPELASQRAEAESKVKTAEAQIAAAQSKLASDQSTFERLQSASKTPGVVAGNDLISSQKTTEADQEQVNAATANANAAREALEVAAQGEKYLRITAPFDGVITERTVHPGALVTPNQSTPMLRIENVKHLRLIVPVPESSTSAVSDHAKVEFTVSSYPTRKFQGTVAR